MHYLPDEFNVTGGLCAHGLGLQEHSIKNTFSSAFQVSLNKSTLFALCVTCAPLLSGTPLVGIYLIYRCHYWKSVFLIGVDNLVLILLFS